MSPLPPYLQQQRLHKICLIVEGYEEEFYFNKILDFPIFKGTYEIKIINAKTASNVPEYYQQEYTKGSHEVVLVVCDKDRRPTEYNNIITKLDLIHGPGKGATVVTYTSPCTLQIILSHFGDVELKTQAKKEARPIVESLTGVKDYDAHKNQLAQICGQIFYRTYGDMKKRVSKISTSPNDIPSTNILTLFERLESSDIAWIDTLNAKLLSDE